MATGLKKFIKLRAVLTCYYCGDVRPISAQSGNLRICSKGLVQEFQRLGFKVMTDGVATGPACPKCQQNETRVLKDV